MIGFERLSSEESEMKFDVVDRKSTLPKKRHREQVRVMTRYTICLSMKRVKFQINQS